MKLRTANENKTETGKSRFPFHVYELQKRYFAILRMNSNSYKNDASTSSI